MLSQISTHQTWDWPKLNWVMDFIHYNNIPFHKKQRNSSKAAAHQRCSPAITIILKYFLLMLSKCNMFGWSVEIKACTSTPVHSVAFSRSGSADWPYNAIQPSTANADNLFLFSTVTTAEIIGFHMLFQNVSDFFSFANGLRPGQS